METDLYWEIREVGSGIIAFVSLILTAALVKYTVTYWRGSTPAQVNARNVAIGLSIFFLALSMRSFELWVRATAHRHGWAQLPGTDTTFVYLLILFLALFGAVYTLRALHPWPLWFMLFAGSLVLPIALVIW